MTGRRETIPTQPSTYMDIGTGGVCIRRLTLLIDLIGDPITKTHSSR
jgi:hypothetical protein